MTDSKNLETNMSERAIDNKENTMSSKIRFVYLLDLCQVFDQLFYNYWFYDYNGNNIMSDVYLNIYIKF